jgi:hypothetical protein
VVSGQEYRTAQGPRGFWESDGRWYNERGEPTLRVTIQPPRAAKSAPDGEQIRARVVGTFNAIPGATDGEQSDAL